MALFPFDYYINSKVTDLHRAAHYLLELHQQGHHDAVNHFAAINEAANLIKQQANYKEEIELRFVQMARDYATLEHQMTLLQKKYQELLKDIEL